MTPKWKRSERVQIAVQKSGRLTDHSMALLKRCGLRLTRGTDQLLAVAENMPVDVLLVRDDEIPGLVREGACDLGIVGLNVAEEQRLALGPEEAPPKALRILDFGGCRLAMAYPKDGAAKAVADLDGLRVASSYPKLTARFLDQAGVKAEIVPFSGAVELAPRLGRAEAICDLVSSGKTLAANQLDEGETVLKSQAALLACPAEPPAARRELLELLKRRIDGVMQARETKYIMLHAPRGALRAIAELLPGSESPTIMALEGSEDRVAVHAVCRESIFWETLEALKEAGASSMLVLPVEKMLE
ncbi:MAG: ATP phosphoribosyltransferase [Gammaproteobacteria bacterium]|nr:ATP phosphoribosyltransferase [Gammaproteobacteria bacterium]